jgi:hypothetical protein
MSHQAALGPPGDSSEDLRTLIFRLVDELDQSPGSVFTVVILSRRFSIKVRRLYDIINVFTAIGCCQRTAGTGLAWSGLSQIPLFLRGVRRDREIDKPENTLARLFPIAGCVGIGNLATNFLLLFAALRTNHLDLRLVGNLFTVGSQRFRATLCKLYQVTFVLSAAGITSRTEHVCEVVLGAGYIDFEILPTSRRNQNDPIFVEAMLNHRRTPGVEFVYERREELRNLWQSGPQSRLGLVLRNDLVLEPAVGAE